MSNKVVGTYSYDYINELTIRMDFGKKLRNPEMEKRSTSWVLPRPNLFGHKINWFGYLANWFSLGGKSIRLLGELIRPLRQVELGQKLDLRLPQFIWCARKLWCSLFLNFRDTHEFTRKLSQRMSPLMPLYSPIWLNNRL